MEKLRTDFAPGMPIQASETNKTNAAINALIDKVGEADVNTIYIDQTRVEAEGRVIGDISCVDDAHAEGCKRCSSGNS